MARYPAELHIVHYNSQYGSLANAAGYSDGLAVLGIFLQVDFSRKLSLIVDSIDSIHNSRRPV